MSAAVIAASVGLVFLWLAIHPFTTYPLSLWLLTRVTSKRASPVRGEPSVPLSAAICVCAYNEEHVIERKIRNLLAMREREPALDILVYVDAASDRTAEILARYADHLTLHVATERHGKTHGMNLLASRTRADLIVFSDANVMLDPDCVRDFRRYFADPQVGCVSGNLVYTNAGESAAASSGSFYWRFEEGLKRLEGLSGSVMGADGSIFAVRRVLHRPPPDHIIDDMFVSLMVLCQGFRVLQATDARGYEESVTSSSEEFRRKVRIACQAFNVHRLLWPQLRRLGTLNLYKYVSHKLIRWLAIYFLAGAAFAFAVALVLAGHAVIALLAVLLACTALALGYLGGVGPFVQIVDVLGAFAGTGLGVWRSLRGERYQTWSPAVSIRQKALP
jgi:cellulose synthase/poly-beta-1,6-N-acetylglucosamine synthase-like glycosyltransferase